MNRQRAVLLAVCLFTQSASAADDCEPRAWDSRFSPMQERNIVDDLVSLQAEGIVQIDNAAKYLGRPSRLERADDSSTASWIYGQRSVHDVDDCHGAASMVYTVAYAIIFLKQASDSNAICRVEEMTFVSESVRPDPYKERASIVPQSLSVSSCEEFLLKNDIAR